MHFPPISGNTSYWSRASNFDILAAQTTPAGIEISGGWWAEFPVPPGMLLATPMSAMHKDSTLLFDLFLGLNRRLVSITRRLAPPLSLAESHVLGEINQQRIVNSSTLIANLHMEKTKVSRTIASFLERGWIEAQQSHADKRVRYFTLTPAGRRTFDADNEARNRQVEEYTQPLSIPEKRDLAAFLQTMADAFGASPVNSMPQDPICKVEIRRLTRAMGYLGDDLLGLGIPVDECQVLHLAHREGNVMSMATLKDLLPYEMTSISRLTTDLQERNFLRKQPMPFDKRHIQIALTQLGITRATKNLREGGMMIFNSLSSLQSGSLRQFIALLEKTLHNSITPVDSEDSRRISINEINTEEMRKAARAFLVDALVTQKRTDEIQGSLIAPENITMQLSQQGKICGVCEFSLNQGNATLNYFLTIPELARSPAAMNLFATACNILLQRSDETELTLKNVAILPEPIRSRLGKSKTPRLTYKVLSVLNSTL